MRIHRLLPRFPREYSNLKSQLRRAAESISDNIVEGCGRESQREFANYLQNAISSANEVEYQLLQARCYDLLDERGWRSLTADVEEARKVIFGLKNKIRADLAKAEAEEARKRRERREKKED